MDESKAFSVSYMDSNVSGFCPVFDSTQIKSFISSWKCFRCSHPLMDSVSVWQTYVYVGYPSVYSSWCCLTTPRTVEGYLAVSSLLWWRSDHLLCLSTYLMGRDNTSTILWVWMSRKLLSVKACPWFNSCASEDGSVMLTLSGVSACPGSPGRQQGVSPLEGSFWQQGESQQKSLCLISFL